PRPRPDRLREHGPARRALPRPPQAPARTHPVAAHPLRAVGPAGRPGEDVLGRHAAAPGDRPRPVAHAEDPVPRRADAGPRPAEPQPALDARPAPEPNR